MPTNIERTKRVLAKDMEKYVGIILGEYGEFIPEARQQFLRGIKEFGSRIIVTDSGTISMFATHKEIIMPIGAYKVFRYLRRIPGFGINKNHQSYKAGEIVNKNTYFSYIKHVIISGMSVEEFYRDSLLHETMHFCGADGGNAIKEGITELKTRELAQKHGLKASRCGYPKEVEIASRLQRIVGVDIINQIGFTKDEREVYRLLQENCGNDIAKLYSEISYLMDKEQKDKYDHSKFGGILGPIKKAMAYSKIDYSKVYEKLRVFEERQAKNQFMNRLREQSVGDISQAEVKKTEERTISGEKIVE